MHEKRRTLMEPDSKMACANRVRAQAFQLAAVTSSALAVHGPVLPQHVLHLVGCPAAARPQPGPALQPDPAAVAIRV